MINLSKIINELNDLDDVTLTTPSDNDLMQYDSGSGLWENQSIATVGDGIYHRLDSANTPFTVAPEAPEWLTTSTINHSITDSSDNFVFTNNNASADIIINGSPKGNPADWLTFNGTDGYITIDAGTIANFGATGGLLDIGSSIAPTSIGVVMNFRTEITSASAIGFWGRPNMNGSYYFELLRYNPTLTGTASAYTLIGLNNQVTAFPTTTHNHSLSFITDASGYATGGAGTTVTHSTLSRSGSPLAFTGGDLTEYGFSYTSAPLQFVGNLNSYAVYVSGMGTNFGGAFEPTNAYSFWSDGGNFALKHDNAQGTMRFGAGEDAHVYYDGTDMVLDPNVVGSGKVLVGATGEDVLETQSRQAVRYNLTAGAA